MRTVLGLIAKMGTNRFLPFTLHTRYGPRSSMLGRISDLVDFCRRVMLGGDDTYIVPGNLQLVSRRYLF